MNDPIIMLPSYDEKVLKRLPQMLVYPQKELDIIRMKIKIFFTLRYMCYNLTMNDGSVALRLKENPMKKDEREQAKWQVGNNYSIALDKEIILCNIKEGQKMQVRYIVVDPDFLILVEPEKTNESCQFKVHFKVPLKHTECAIDKMEPRNLVVAYASFK